MVHPRHEALKAEFLVEHDDHSRLVSRESFARVSVREVPVEFLDELHLLSKCQKNVC